MVCLGNICRSPLAEGILQQKARIAGLNWTVDSAGTNGYHNGEAPHRLSQQVARVNGIDISTQRSRKVVPADFAEYDRIYAMAKDVLTDLRRIGGTQFNPGNVTLLLNELHPGTNSEVPDPWYGTAPDYHEVYTLLDAACTALINNFMQQHTQELQTGNWNKS